MSVLNKLATSLNVRGTEPNKQLAKNLAKSKDTKAIQELVDNLHNKNRRVQSDCIKVLYELAEIDPTLVAGHAKTFIQLLDSKNNRMQWGAMTALDMITSLQPKLIYAALGGIIAVADKGSVITTDHCVGILLKLCAFKQYKAEAFDLYLEQLQKCPTNQLPAYAEKALPFIDDTNKSRFTNILTARLVEVDQESKRKRIEKVLKKVK